MKSNKKVIIKISLISGIFISFLFLIGWLLKEGGFFQFNRKTEIYNLGNKIGNGQLSLQTKSTSILKASLNPKNEDDTLKNKVLIKLKEGGEEKITEHGIPGEKIEKKDKLEIYEVDISDQKSPEDLVDELSSSSDIEYAEFDQKIQALLTPNDTYYLNQWALSKISAPSAWDQTTGLNTVTVAVIDSGADGIHQDLTGKVLAGYNFVNDTPILANSNSDDLGHGTLCAGVAAAVSNNSKGIAGIDWNVQIMPIKVLNSVGTGTYSDLIDGITWATDNGADVISMSLGSYSSSSSLEDALGYAYTNGVISFGAAGNNNVGTIIYPAAYDDYVIAVGATNQSDERCAPSDWGYDQYGSPQGSNYGVELDVMAPGNYILSTYWMQSNPYNAYAYTGGTSLACPHVAGLACLLIAKNSNLRDDPNQIREIIAGTCDKVSGMGGEERTNYHGYGRINLNSALNNATAGIPDSQQKIAVVKNDYQKYNFYIYQGPTGAQACSRTDSNFWDITSGDKVMAVAYLDGDKIGVIKRSGGGDENFYLYEAPAGPDSCQLLGQDLWNIPSENNVVSIAGVDYDADGQDELAVLKIEPSHGPGDQNLYIYELPSGSQAMNAVGQDLWNIPSGNNTVSIGGVNLTGGGADKIATIKNESGDHNFYIYNVPQGVQACVLVASDLWNIPSGDSAISIAGVDYSGDGTKDKIAVMKNENGDFNLYVYNLPATLGTPATLYGQDLWNIPSGNNTIDLGG